MSGLVTGVHDMSPCGSLTIPQAVNRAISQYLISTSIIWPGAWRGARGCGWSNTSHDELDVVSVAPLAGAA